MSWIQRLCSSFRTKKYDKDLDSELAFHLEMRKKERVSQGATDEEARGQALERFGNLTRTKEACREQSTFPSQPQRVWRWASALTRRCLVS
jgi:hypothetical protein